MQTQGDNFLEDAVVILKLSPEGYLEWQSTIKHNRSTYLRSMGQTEDGGYLVSISLGQFYDSVYEIIKLDPNGNIEWQHFLGLDGYYGTARSIVSAADGGFPCAWRTWICNPCAGRTAPKHWLDGRTND